MAGEAAGLPDLKTGYFEVYKEALLIHLPQEPEAIQYEVQRLTRDNIPLNNAFFRFLKRTLDISFSLLVITCILSWLIPVLALLIKLDSGGPVFFLQRRNGRNGKLFTCIKFRSMKVNSECDILPADENDQRITRIGRFLRKHHIDEFPQFFNVLRGDMTVIGPRPHMVTDNLKYDPIIPHYAFRHTVKPGITGLAQVAGNVGAVTGLSKMEHRVLLDSLYIKHWSLMLDLRIMYSTFRILFSRRKGLNG